jgi:Phosphodiester glycosidase
MKVTKQKIFLLAVGIIFFGMLTYLFISSNPAIPAQAADDVLRPILGEKETIDLESVYFSLNDQADKVKYSYEKPNANIYSSSLISNSLQVKAASTESSMDLTDIPIHNTFSPLPQEGVWQPIENALFPHTTVLARTFVRPDPTRSYALVSLVKMNMKELRLGLVAGTYYPGGPYKKFGTGYVPKDIQEANELVAAFNGGFMAADGQYGMIVGDTTYVPLRKNLATLLLYANGDVKLIDYQGQPLPQTVIAVRQNGAFLVHDGIISPYIEKSTDTWGRTTTDSIYTWRSGIGITKNGNLIYAVGNSLVPTTLAQALKDAGAVEAMQLDINPYWVRYIVYDSVGNGTYTYTPLLNVMENGGYSYLHGYNKDFFYVYKKNQ